MFNVGYDALQLAPSNPKYYGTADSIFTRYKTKYPDQSYGYQYLATSKLMQGDTTAATPFVQDYINFMSNNKDSVSYKPFIGSQYGILANYYVNSKSDYPTGLKYLQAMYALDPTNADVKQAMDQVQAAVDAANKNKK
jgi:predicted Zn-dependent protease